MLCDKNVTRVPPAIHMKNLSLFRRETVPSQTGKIIDIIEPNGRGELYVFDEQKLKLLGVENLLQRHQVKVI